MNSNIPFTEEEINNSYRYCQQIAKSNSSFYTGMLFASKEKRKQLFSIYAWMRAVDDIADDENLSNDAKYQNLKKFSEITHHIVNGVFNKATLDVQNPYWPAFYQTVHKTKLPLIILEEMIKGQMQDLIKHDYKTFVELHEYCRLVASTVGLACIHIWGYTGGETTHLLAEKYGIAIQLTNILRDIEEDLHNKRVYLPAELVGVPELSYKNFVEISQEKRLNGVKQLITKATIYFKEAATIINYIHKDGRLSFLLLISYYKEIFAIIHANPIIVFQNKKIKLSKFKKIRILLVCIIKSFFRR